MNNAIIVMKKELARVFLDKKLIFSLFILPAVLMFGIYSIMGSMIGRFSSDIMEHISKVYILNAPEDFKEKAENKGYFDIADVTVLPSDTSAETITTVKDDILNGDAELLVEFDKDFINTASSYKNEGDAIPNVTIYYNTSGNYSNAARNNFVNLILDDYKNTILSGRFGGNLEVLNAFNVKNEVIVNEDKANGEFLGMLVPYLIVMLLFSSAMGLCVDAIAGEKERGTLASLLLSPIKRSELVFGKLTALSILSTLSAIVYSVSLILAMPLMGSSGTMSELNMNVHFSAFQIISLLIIMVALVYMYVGIISVISVLCKNTKEASTYISPLYILIIVAGMLTMFQGGVEKSDLLFAIPVYGTALSIQNIMTNELTALQLAFSAGGTILAGVVITFAIAKAFKSERIMFNA
jgi:sodium transport system permease protein